MRLLPSILFLLTLFGLVQKLNGQTQLWSIADSALGSVGGSFIEVDDANNVYVGSHGSSQFMEYALVFKYDPAGNKLWNFKFPDAGIRAMVTSKGGSTYIAGIFSLNDGDALVAKVSPSGNLVWYHTLDYNNGSDNYWDLKIDDSENIYITGHAQVGSTIFTSKLDSSGNYLWTQTYPTEFLPRTLVLDEVQNVLVGADYEDGFQVIKYTNVGVFQWQQYYSSPDCDELHTSLLELKADHDNNIDVMAWLTTGGFGCIEAGIFQLSPGGVFNWQKFVHTLDIADLVVDDKNNLYVVGNIYDYLIMNNSASITKFTQAGDSLWTSTYTDTSFVGQGYRIAYFRDHHLYLCGTSYGYGDMYDYLTVKADSNGIVEWAANYNGFFNDYDRVNDIAVDNAGSVLVTGEAKEYDSLSNTTTTVKYLDTTIALSGALLNLKDDFRVSVSPNPFHDEFTIEFHLLYPSNVTILIYNIEGRQVNSLNREMLSAGFQRVSMHRGQLLPGVYFIDVKTGEGNWKGKLIAVQ